MNIGIEDSIYEKYKDILKKTLDANVESIMMNSTPHFDFIIKKEKDGLILEKNASRFTKNLYDANKKYNAKDIDEIISLIRQLLLTGNNKEKSDVKSLNVEIIEKFANEVLARKLFESLNIDASEYFRKMYKKTSHIFNEYHILINPNEKNDCWTTWYIADKTEIGLNGDKFFENTTNGEMLHLHCGEYFWAIKHYDEILSGIKTRIDKYMKEIDK